MKLVKNRPIPRSTMPDERLSALVVISIANKISSLDSDALINQFEKNMARRKRFE